MLQWGYFFARISTLEGIVRGLKDELENLPGPETFQVLHEVFNEFPNSRVSDTSCLFFLRI